MYWWPSLFITNYSPSKNTKPRWLPKYIEFQLQRNKLRWKWSGSSATEIVYSRDGSKQQLIVVGCMCPMTNHCTTVYCQNRTHRVQMNYKTIQSMTGHDAWQATCWIPMYIGERMQHRVAQKVRLHETRNRIGECLSRVWADIGEYLEDMWTGNWFIVDTWTQCQTVHDRCHSLSIIPRAGGGVEYWATVPDYADDDRHDEANLFIVNDHLHTMAGWDIPISGQNWNLLITAKSYFGYTMYYDRHWPQWSQNPTY